MREIKVVLIRTLISDQLGYVNIAKEWFTISDLSEIRWRKIGGGKIGAGSNNSNLKNNYGAVKVHINGNLVNSGEQFVGLFMADHAKAGINTMFNTGTVVGVMTVVYGSDFLSKNIPSYCWGGNAGFVEHDLDKALETAATVMKRRNRVLQGTEMKLLSDVFRFTSIERQAKCDNSLRVPG